MKFIENSSILRPIDTVNNDPVILFQQFFIHKNKERLAEIKYCLRQNVDNKFINRIILLNERLYSNNELGVNSSKITQIIIGHRLTYRDVIEYVKLAELKAYVVIANADIFVDETIHALSTVDMVNDKKVLAQLRWEFEGDITAVKIFQHNGMPRWDSQDVWIFHTAHIDCLYERVKAFSFELGQAGCDNHITYLFKILGFDVVNDPMLIHCLHFHKTQIREYSSTNSIKPPYLLVNPVGSPQVMNEMVKFDDNLILYNFICKRFKDGMNFVIPRVAGVENNTAFTKSFKWCRQNVMKNNAGILLTSQESVERYSNAYLKAFENCHLYTGWEKSGDVYKGISSSQDFVQFRVASNSRMCWAFALDIFHYIYNMPWTFALKAKRILIVSAFAETIRGQINKREKIYGIDLFPECTFVFIKPPQTQGENVSEEWDVELAKFDNDLAQIDGQYDVALVSAGGYGNLICNMIYEKYNKSSIYVGGVLQMYFGVLGNRWLEERASVVRMYLNEHWTRPSKEERPIGHTAIEKGCYF
jgi:hypothetical protein